MKYRHSFRIRAPLDMVARFHRRAASLVTLTPTAAGLRMEAGPETLNEGDEVSFSFWLGPLRIQWRARIEGVSSTGFTDRQIDGPFRQWVHRHTFNPVDSTTTEVVDEVQAELRHHPMWTAAGLSMWLFLPVMFKYRGEETRRLLERKVPSP